MKHSLINEHENTGGELIPPFLNGELGEKIELHSWSKERVPEYLWIGLLRNSCKSKQDYYEKMKIFKDYLLDNYEEPLDKFSNIISLDKNDKIEVFEMVKKIFGDYILDPLIVVSKFDSELRQVFFNKMNSNDDRIKIIQKVISKMYERYDEFAMDIRYMVIIFKLNKIRIKKGMIIEEAIQKYPYTNKDNPSYTMYTSLLSSFEGMDFAIKSDYSYSKYFYEEMYLMSDCNLQVLSYETNEKEADELKEKMNGLRELLIKSNEIGYDDKKDVIVGNIIYIYKQIKSLLDNNLCDSIISRLVLRTIIEMYVNLKYLSINSINQPKIWESYKDYGSGKYKLIYKKIEEGSVSKENCTHFNHKLLKIFANENKSEEFLKVKFGMFADKKIRQKFIDVGEKELYDTYYDYDTCFTHGYWSAIRESSLLFCDNVCHNYHCVADIECEQKLIPAYNDLSYIVNKIIVLINEELGVHND